MLLDLNNRLRNWPCDIIGRKQASALDFKEERYALWSKYVDWVGQVGPRQNLADVEADGSGE